MVSALQIAQYLADRHTAAMVAAFFAYVCVVVWCGSTGAREVQQRAAAASPRHPSVLGIPLDWESAFSATAVVHSVSVAILRLTDADAELLHGGPLNHVQSQAERQRRLLSLASQWQYHFAVGDFTLVSAPPRLIGSGLLEEWIAKLQSVYPACVFASLAGGGGNGATVDDRRLLILPSEGHSHRRALMGEQHQQSLRVLRLDTLPAPETLRRKEATAAITIDEDDGGAEDPLFVFVSEDATRKWSAAVDAAELTRPSTKRWRSGASGLDAWEEMLQVTSVSSGMLRSAAAAVATSLAADDPSSSRLSRLLEPLCGKKAQAPATAVGDAAQYIPRLAADLADTYAAPYVILASWCSSASTYGWIGRGMCVGRPEGRALVLVLCLRDNELVEIIPSRQHLSRLVQ